MEFPSSFGRCALSQLDVRTTLSTNVEVERAGLVPLNDEITIVFTCDSSYKATTMLMETRENVI